MFKNKLQEYAQKKSLPLPVYHTVNDGTDHFPQFKSSTTINGTKYESPPGFSHKKEAENAAAKEAVEDFQRHGFKFKERKRPKCVLAELSSMKNLPPPTYHFIKSVTATVEIDGVSYTGAPANNLKEAANKAAFEAIWAIDPHYCLALSLVELNESNDSEQPTGESHASKSESKIPTEKMASNHQLLGGTESQSAESPEKFNVDDASGLEKDSEKTDVEDHAQQSHNQPRQDPLRVQQGHLKKETGNVYQDKEHGSEKIQGKQQSSQEVHLTDSIGKRNKIESENAEYMSQRTKKHKGKKSNGTARHK